jgi:plastocyanin
MNHPTITTRSRFRFALSDVIAATVATCTHAALTALPADAAAKVATIEVTAAPSSLKVDASTYKPGWTKITLTNNDKDSHQAALIRISNGMSADDFAAKLAAEGTRALSGTTSSGGPAVAFPGRWSSVTVNLTEGTYMAMDLVPGVDGKPKATKGFATSFVVKSSFGGSGSRKPRANATVELHERSVGNRTGRLPTLVL